MSTVLKAIYKLINDRIQGFIDEGKCPPTRVFYENDDNNSEILNAKITAIDDHATDNTKSIVKISNSTNMSLYIQGMILTSRKITNGTKGVYVKKHLSENAFTTHDRLEIARSDKDKFSVNDNITLEIPNSIYLKSELLSLPSRSYANTMFYKTESFILSCEIRTRDDSNSFELEDITDVLKDIFEDYYGKLPISTDKYVSILDRVKIFDDIEEGSVLQKRTVKVMLGYNVVNTKYIR